jgi:dTDP-4-dehydrorhamnose 3,5-epimerase-like enzyme
MRRMIILEVLTNLKRVKMFSVDDCGIVDLSKIHSDAGNITVLENNKNIPFEIKRIYYLYDVPMGSERGGHSHYDLQQYVVAVSGSFTFVLDDGKKKKEVFLNSPTKALHIKTGIWREMKDFSSGSVCLVLASNNYSESDYIREYHAFLNYRNNA